MPEWRTGRRVRHPPQLVEQQTGNQKGRDSALRFTVCYYEVIHHWNCGSEDRAKYHMGSTEARSPMLFWLLWSLWKQFFRGFRMEWFCGNQSTKGWENITRKSEDSALADRDRHCVSTQTDFSGKKTLFERQDLESRVLSHAHAGGLCSEEPWPVKMPAHITGRD